MLELKTCQSDTVPRGKEPQGCKQGWELVTELKVRLGTSALVGDPVRPYPHVFWVPIPMDHLELGVKNLQVYRYLWVFTDDGSPELTGTHRYIHGYPHQELKKLINFICIVGYTVAFYSIWHPV